MKKSLKWILLGAGVLILAAALILTLSFCGKGPGAADPDGPEAPTVGDMTDYTVQITNEEGTPLEGIGVYIYQDETQSELTWFDKTDSNGQITFTDLARETYIAVLQDIPTGYEAEAQYLLTGTTTQIVLKVGAMTEEDMANIKYMLGDKMMDFTVTDTDGKTHTLSELLKTKKAVVLNFWYTNCEPCKLEFPFLSEAYNKYTKDLELLAMNPVDSDAAAVAQFKKDNGLPFPVVVADPVWQDMMQVTGYPTTVVIDRYGNISLIHKGGIESTNTFEQIFAYFTADEYVAKPIKSIDEIVEELPVGTKENPFETGSFKKLEVTVKPGETYYLRLYKQVAKWYLSIEGKDCDGDFTLMYKEKEHDDEDGELTIQIKPDGAFVPVELAITNNSDEEQTYVLSRSTAKGSYDNPYKLKLGEFEAKIAAGNDQGVYYTYTAEQSGELRITCLESSIGNKFGLTLYNLKSYAMRNWTSESTELDENGNPYVAVRAKKGQKIQFILNTEPNDSNKYPAGKFTLLAAFTEGLGEYLTEDDLPKTTYTITVVDQNSEPIPDITVDFTGDFTYVLELPTTETTVEGEGEAAPGEGETTPETPTQEFHIRVNEALVTDKKGVITTERVTGPYTATVRLPEGYRLETTKFDLTPEAPDVTVNMHRIIMADYTVTLKNPDGTPFAGKDVMLGTEMATTDKNGKVTFHKEVGQYSITILDMPEGQALPNGENTMAFPEGETSLELALAIMGTQQDPYPIAKFPYTTVELAAGESIYARITGDIHYDYTPVLTVKDADAVITYNGTEYTANAAGILQIPMDETAEPVLLIKNGGSAAEALTLEMFYPVGTQYNPRVIASLDEIKVTLAEDDQDGYYLQYTPENAGDLTLSVSAVTPENTLYDATVTTQKSGTVTFENGTAAAYVRGGEHAIICLKAQDAALTVTLSGTFEIDPNGVDESQAIYNITVADYDGTPVSNAAVQILKDGSLLHTLRTDAEGKVGDILMDKGTYQVVVAASGYYYDAKTGVLTETVTDLTVKMTRNLPSTEPVTSEDTDTIGAVPKIEVGATYVQVPSAESYKYFVFCPGVSGTYRITTSHPDMKPSYWLTVNYIMENTGYYQADGNYIDISVGPDQIETQHVVGFKGDTEAVIIVERIGKHDWNIEEEPYDSQWQSDYVPVNFDFKGSVQALTYVAVKDPSKYYAPVLGDDGFYHLNSADGPLLYVNFGTDAPISSIQTMMHGDGGPQGGRGLGRTFWKDLSAPLTQDNFIKKEDYTNCLDAYIACAYNHNDDDEIILYPLTDDIMYAIQNGCIDLWSDPNNLLYENFAGSVAGRQWMFLVCYEDTGDIDLTPPEGYEPPVTPDDPGVGDDPAEEKELIDMDRLLESLREKLGL